jgi:hypothetical protein
VETTNGSSELAPALVGILSSSRSAAWCRSRRCSTIENTIEKVEGMRPYTPLELAGRDIYVREGCYVCHSQMIRPLARRGRALRPLLSWRPRACTTIPSSGAPSAPGRTSRASAASTPDEWHVAHLIDPRSVVPESIMPPYAFPAISATGGDGSPQCMKHFQNSHRPGA